MLRVCGGRRVLIVWVVIWVGAGPRSLGKLGLGLTLWLMMGRHFGIGGLLHRALDFFRDCISSSRRLKCAEGIGLVRRLDRAKAL